MKNENGQTCDKQKNNEQEKIQPHSRLIETGSEDILAMNDCRLAEAKLNKIRCAVGQIADSILITDREGVIEYVNPFFEHLTGYSKEEAIGKTPRILKSDDMGDKEYSSLWKTIREGNVYQGEVINRKKNGELFYEEVTITPIRDDSGIITHFVKLSHNVTERILRERELEALNIASIALRKAKTLVDMVPILLDKTLELTHAAFGSIWLYDPDHGKLQQMACRKQEEYGEYSMSSENPDEEVVAWIFETGRPYVSCEISQDTRLSDKSRRNTPQGVGGAMIPIFLGDNRLGIMNVYVKLPRELIPVDIRVLTTLSEVAANTIQRMRSHEKTQRDALRFAALHSIDVSINASDDLNMTLNILLDQVINLLKVSAAAILLFNPYTNILEFSAGKGFWTRQIEKSHVKLGEGFTGQAALKRQTVNSPDLRIVGLEYGRRALLLKEEFAAYYGVPLIVNGKIVGVLDIFHRALLDPDPEWLDFMEALAIQAAIAIDNATLFKKLQQSNMELLQAYDKTIEGWSKAMDLRDHETEGHTQRVTELTERLAKTMGVRDEDIVHMRRGALLHDMGKVGIPDNVLLKPGTLNEEEWAIMKQHPRYAFDMLSPIEFLKQALDIPYCHHEKWDGTGYPRGLKNEQIPLAARIFAIVDVWDALRSDRPYRSAWSKEKTLNHIKSLSGTHFEPRIVELFLEMMEDSE